MATEKDKAIVKKSEENLLQGLVVKESRKILRNEKPAKSSPNETVVPARGKAMPPSDGAIDSEAELTYVDGLAASLHETMSDMFNLGMVSPETMREFDKACLTPVATFDGQAVKALREREQVSQAVLSHYIGVAVNTIGQWERGERKPSGAAAKMLALIERHGLNYVR